MSRTMQKGLSPARTANSPESRNLRPHDNLILSQYGRLVQGKHGTVAIDFWQCLCRRVDICPADQAECPLCGAKREERPLASLANVIMALRRAQQDEESNGLHEHCQFIEPDDDPFEAYDEAGSYEEDER